MKIIETEVEGNEITVSVYEKDSNTHYSVSAEELIEMHEKLEGKLIVVSNKFGGVDRLTIEEATKRLNSQAIKIRKFEKMMDEYRFNK